VEENLVKAIEWADLVVIATGNESIDDRAATIALSLGKLVNNGTNAQKGNIIVPFRGITSYGLRIAVTSLGVSGIGARVARDRILDYLEKDGYVRTLYNVMARVKTYLKSRIPDPKERIPLYFKVEDDSDFQRLVESSREEEAYERALEIIEEHIHGQSTTQ
jgi:precorrin-2 dehydrogenase/sirohydrochlorin ferrochelatase